MFQRKYVQIAFCTDHIILLNFQLQYHQRLRSDSEKIRQSNIFHGKRLEIDSTQLYNECKQSVKFVIRGTPYHILSMRM